MSEQQATASFVRDLHKALVHLYDPTTLRASPLVALFCLEQPQNPAAALQQLLLAAIEELKPSAETPPQAKAWRTYRVLFHRYTEQCSQREVMATLGLSERQLRREEHLALQLLADRLWAQYGLALRAPSPSGAPSTAKEDQEILDAGTPSREEELEWVRKSLAGETAEVDTVIQGAVSIITPLLRAYQVRLALNIPQGLPQVLIAPATLRQALLNVLAAAIRSVPKGQVQLCAQEQGQTVEVRVVPQREHSPYISLSPNDLENLEMARQLVALAGASLKVTPGQGHAQSFLASFSLPTGRKGTVLFIEDNADTLELFQRCLTGTRYRFLGTRDPDEALALTDTARPWAIVLDLMMPGMDGWEVLGRLREHPRTRGIPILVCSILPQEQLALTLGAAAFLRKPVSRAALLAALDQIIR